MKYINKTKAQEHKQKGSNQSTMSSYQRGDGDNYIKESKPYKQQKPNRNFIGLGVLLFLFIVHTWVNFKNGGLINGERHVSKEQQQQHYMAVIDAGSSGSRIHVYQYHYTGTVKVVAPSHETHKEKPGLSSYGNDPTKKPEDAGESIKPLVEFAKQHIPPDQVSNTPILLKATAGMRLLHQDNPGAANSILASVKLTLSNSEFQFSPSDAHIIDGQEEGMLGWLALNYLIDTQSPQKNLRGKTDQKPSWSVFEMGAASVQVSFPLESSSEIPKEYVLPYRSPTSGQKEEMYTHSFLGYGVQSAKKRKGRK